MEPPLAEIHWTKGEISYNFIPILNHPVGTVEQLPVIVVAGEQPGPTLWITGNVHGNEYSGILVIPNLIKQLDPKKLKGTVVAIPTLNPSGSRTKSRSPYYDRRDPNRLFPDGNPESKNKKELPGRQILYDKEGQKQAGDTIVIKSEKEVQVTLEPIKKRASVKDPMGIYEQETYPSVQEEINAKIYKLMEEKADFLVDLHNAYIQSIPFVFLDRVLYEISGGKEARLEAEKLFRKTQAMCEAFGFTIIRETSPERYVQKKLHRSVSGSALNKLRIPAITVELGMYLEVDKKIAEAAVIGILNILKWAGMLAGSPEKITTIPVVTTKEPVRYLAHPRAPENCVVDLQIKQGDFVKKGDLIANALDIFGRKLPENGEIRSEVDGFVFMINEGIFRYKNEEICWIAVKDYCPEVFPWPKKEL